MSIVQTHWYHDMTESEIGCTRKSLLNPELLQLYLATLLGLLFPFAAFLVFLLIGQTSATVFKLNCRNVRDWGRFYAPRADCNGSRDH